MLPSVKTVSIAETWPANDGDSDAVADVHGVGAVVDVVKRDDCINSAFCLIHMSGIMYLLLDLG